MNIKTPYDETQAAMLKILDTLKEIAPDHEREVIANLIAAPWSDPDNFDMRVSKAVLGLCNLVAVCWNSQGFQNGVREGLRMQSRPPMIEMAQDPMTEEAVK